MSKEFGIPSNKRKHLGNSRDYWKAPQKNSKQIIIQSMDVPENMKQITDLSNQLMNEELNSINPILPQDNLFVSKGWQCPICGRVYSPTTPMCLYCSNKKIVNQQTTI